MCFFFVDCSIFLYFFFFFFQAEDGIRDPLVTGVQTCALPIWSFASLHEASETDAQGNVARGDVISEDTEGSYLHSESRLVAAVGLKDHVVIETKDAVLVTPDRKSTRLNSSHEWISYAVFCLKK